MLEQKFNSMKWTSVRQKYLKLWEREANRTELSGKLHKVVPINVPDFFLFFAEKPENSVPFVYMYSEFIDREFSLCREEKS